MNGFSSGREVGRQGLGNHLICEEWGIREREKWWKHFHFWASVKSWLTGKDPDAGRDWGQEEKGTTEDEMAGWHHWLHGRESEWTPGVGVGQGGLACCDSWGHKEWDTTERLNWTERGICDLPGSSDGKASANNAADPGSIPGSGRSPAEGNGNPLQYSCLENPMDREAW